MKYGIKIFGFNNLNIYLQYLTNQPHVKIFSILSDYKKNKYMNIDIEKIYKNNVDTDILIIDNINQYDLKNLSINSKYIIFIKSTDFIKSPFVNNKKINFFIFNIFNTFYKKKFLKSYLEKIEKINKIIIFFPKKNINYTKNDFILDFIYFIEQNFNIKLFLEKLSKDKQLLKVNNNTIEIHYNLTKNDYVSLSFDKFEKIDFSPHNLALEYFFNNLFLDIVENKNYNKISDMYLSAKTNFY